MELTGRDPKHSVLGSDESDYHPDAGTMMKWLKLDVRSTNLLCDLLLAIRHQRIWAEPNFLANDNVLDPFTQLIRMSEAKKVQQLGKVRGKQEAELLLHNLLNYEKIVELNKGGRPSAQFDIIEACAEFVTSQMSAKKAYQAALKGRYPKHSGDPPPGWSWTSFKRAYRFFRTKTG